MSSEKFCLKWNDFQRNASGFFGELRDDTDLCDVTLASQDNQQIKAHKVVLAASSPFFMAILRNNKHSHPLIYMRGIKSSALEAIVDFMYNGETNIFQEDLDTFLALAEELQLKGLVGAESTEDHNNKELKEDKPMKPNKCPTRSERLDNKQIKDSSFRTNETADIKSNSYEGSTTLVTAEPLDKPIIALHTDLDDLQEKLNSIVEKVDGIWTCNICGKTNNLNKRNDVRRHAENHIEGVSHPCSICGKTFRSSNAIRQHSNQHR